MSRVGKKPIELPAGVKAKVSGPEVLIEGPKGKLTYNLPQAVELKQEENRLVFSSAIVTKQERASFGSARAHVNNMIKGVTKGWKRSLEMNGVGFSATLNGKKLKLVVGYSHDVILDVPANVSCKVDKTSIELESTDKQLVGNFAAAVRRVCPPEPYLGKGIKFSEEVVRRKAGKTGK